METATIHVNFARPVPLFPLRGVTLLPHALAPLHIFEPRYRQMIQHALDGPGLIAMGVLADRDADFADAVGEPPVRPVVCLGRIAQHERLPDGRYNVLLQGVCRARIRKDLTPEGDRLYRMAILEPIDRGAAQMEQASSEPPGVRRRLRRMLSHPPLSNLVLAEGVCGYLKSADKPLDVVLELVGMSVAADSAVRYRLLAEPDAGARARIIEDELRSLEGVLRRATPQLDPDAPKGVMWN